MISFLLTIYFLLQITHNKKFQIIIYLFRNPIDRFEPHINFKYELRRNMLGNNLDKIYKSKGSFFALDICNYMMKL